MKKPKIGKILAAVVVLAVAFIIWLIAFPHSTGTSAPVSLDDAKGCPIPLPKSAHSIQFFKHEHFIEFAEFVKFHAPPQDCLKHVQTVLVKWRQDFSKETYPDPAPMTSIETRPAPSYFAQQFGVTWFDPQTIKEGMSTGESGSGVPSIWVDTQRGIFYYKLTD